MSILSSVIITLIPFNKFLCSKPICEIDQPECWILTGVTTLTRIARNLVKLKRTKSLKKFLEDSILKHWKKYGKSTKFVQRIKLENAENF